MEALTDIRTLVWLLIVFAGLVSGWTYMKARLAVHDEKITAKGVAIKESEERILTKLKEMSEHFEEDVTRLGKNQRTIFEKLDRLTDNLANAVGDIRVTMTAMAGKYGNDEALLVMIRDIGKKRNGR